MSSKMGATAQGGYAVVSTTPENDPYSYQVGFGNRFASEAIPGVLPSGQNSPQKCKYDLYAEQMTATSFVAPRAQNQNACVCSTTLPPNLSTLFLPDGFTKSAHQLLTKVSINSPTIQIATQLAWYPFDLPPDSSKVDFIDGLKTLAGNGDPSLREGLAIHVYTANQSMENKAYCNNDGDFLILPQQGRLDIQTEFGKWVACCALLHSVLLMARPGELVVIQRGMKFKISLPDGPSRGYIQEIFGSHYELPDLGPLGASGLAQARDFEYPVAHFDIDQSPWESEVGGKHFSCKQEHTPFDVVAWHGNYAPYKYAMEKFTNVGSISKDHIDPSIFCVLTAKSKTIGTPLADLLIFSPRWDVATGTFRPPYYHRNVATEFMGLIYGDYGGRSDEFAPGGASYETGFCPHGVSYDEFKGATEAELKPMRVHEGTIAFMFESSMMFTLTDYAMKRTGKLHEHEPKMWDNLKGQFLNHLDQVNSDLKAAGLPPLGPSGQT
ncbi:hypothetical protein JAAARDRAFT_127432 [Jaapia argillacea MUCL 33604]|uniref:homogentisate 1,2-dioxygenase n=1 Tax=Jaapia argillacea MUCL 33604 TaxID=933084 RepID=A0A067PX44_9AGAM|nr:hypothetical protein JAAARDRAFT_127432 [Jaapia argillacea MUCL 33604]